MIHATKQVHPDLLKTGLGYSGLVLLARLLEDTNQNTGRCRTKNGEYIYIYIYRTVVRNIYIYIGVQEHEMLCRDPAKKDRTEQIQPRRLAGCVVCTCVRAGESGRTIAPQREAGRRPPQHSILQACHACMCIGATTDRGTAAACGRAGRRQERPSLPFQSVDDTATGAPAPASRRALMRRFTLTATATYEYDRPDPTRAPGGRVVPSVR